MTSSKNFETTKSLVARLAGIQRLDKDLGDINNKVKPYIELNDLIREISPLDDYIQESAKWNACTNCKLCETRVKVVFGGGSVKPRLVVIGEAPGPNEDTVGVPFVGKTGSFFREVIEKVGINTEEVYFTNAVACIPKDSISMPFRTPTAQEISACSGRLRFVYEHILPSADAVIMTGKIGFAAWMAIEKNDQSFVDTVLSAKFSAKENLGWHVGLPSGKPAYFIYHPSYIERQGRSKTVTQPWIDDIKAVRSYLNDKQLKNNTDRQTHDHSGVKNAQG